MMKWGNYADIEQSLGQRHRIWTWNVTANSFLYNRFVNDCGLFTFEVQYQHIMRAIAILQLVLLALPASAIDHASSITVQQSGRIQAAITSAHA
jgi:hypothetical protein